MKKKIGIILIIVSSLLITSDIISGIYLPYKYNNEIKSYWELADKSSTIDKKSEYVDKFVNALEESGLKGQYNAIIFKTPDNSFDYNFEALKSLQLRLHEIKTMDVTSFQYQTAIQQITAQEQGEASNMLREFKGTWFKTNHILFWDWIYMSQVALLITTFIIGVFLRSN